MKKLKMVYLFQFILISTIIKGPLTIYNSLSNSFINNFLFINCSSIDFSGGIYCYFLNLTSSKKIFFTM